MELIKRKANLIVERRKKILKANIILAKMLDIFEVYQNEDFMVWQVSLIKDGNSPFCMVAFSNARDAIHFSQKDLLENDEYITLEKSNPLILAMEEVDNIATKEVFFDLVDFLKHTVLENFNVAYNTDRITIQMDEKAICEKEEPQK